MAIEITPKIEADVVKRRKAGEQVGAIGKSYKQPRRWVRSILRRKAPSLIGKRTENGNGTPKKARAKVAAKRASGKRKALGITKAQSARRPAVTKKQLKGGLVAAAAQVQA